MKIKEVQAGIKITKNYNSYQDSLTAKLETGESPEIIGKELMKQASNIVNKNIGIELNPSQLQEKIENIKPVQATINKEIEVGAAWLDKKFQNKLSVKDSKTGKWKKVNLFDLEEIDIGYKQETAEGIFIFKKLSEKERINSKMPVYRIYKVE